MAHTIFIAKKQSWLNSAIPSWSMRKNEGWTSGVGLCLAHTLHMVGCCFRNGGGGSGWRLNIVKWTGDKVLVKLLACLCWIKVQAVYVYYFSDGYMILLSDYKNIFTTLEHSFMSTYLVGNSWLQILLLKSGL